MLYVWRTVSDHDDDVSRDDGDPCLVLISILYFIMY